MLTTLLQKTCQMPGLLLHPMGQCANATDGTTRTMGQCANAAYETTEQRSQWARTESNVTLQHECNGSTAGIRRYKGGIAAQVYDAAAARRGNKPGIHKGSKQNKQSSTLHCENDGKGGQQGETWRGEGGHKIVSKRVDARSAREGVTHFFADDSQTVSENMCETRYSRTVSVTHFLSPKFFTHT